MKVFVVEMLDTNGVSCVDKVFMLKNDADKYINIQEKAGNSLVYFVREHNVLANAI